MKPLQVYVSNRLQQLAAVLAACVGIATLLLYKLGHLTHGLGTGEQAVQKPHTIIHGLVHNPLFLPIQLIRLLVSLAPFQGAAAARFPSVIVGALLLLSFGVLCRYWYGRRTAYLGLILLAVSSWFLHISRLATNDVLYAFSVTTLLLFYTFWQRNKTPSWLWLAPLVNGILLYAPGLVWFIALGIIWQWELYKDGLTKLALALRLVWLLVWLPVLALLAYALWRTPHLIYTWAGLPAHVPRPQSLVHNWLSIWQHIFVRGPESPLIGLGYLPLLSIFTTVMVGAGAYFYAVHWRAGRSRVLLICALTGSILAALGGPVSINILLPIMFVVAAGGIGYLLKEWFDVFPRNPLAKVAGYSLVTLALLFTVVYNLRLYFVAWPDAPITQTAFHRPL